MFILFENGKSLGSCESKPMENAKKIKLRFSSSAATLRAKARELFTTAVRERKKERESARLEE